MRRPWRTALVVLVLLGLGGGFLVWRQRQPLVSASLDPAFPALGHATRTVSLILRAGTGSLVLRSMCDAFLRDESAHLLFHAERLAIIRSGRPRVLVALTRAGFGALLLGTAAVVWVRHRRALGLARCGPMAFAVSCLQVAASELALPEPAALSAPMARW